MIFTGSYEKSKENLSRENLRPFCFCCPVGSVHGDLILIKRFPVQKGAIFQ